MSDPRMDGRVWMLAAALVLGAPAVARGQEATAPVGSASVSLGLDRVPAVYKPGEVFPLTLFHGIDFLEPLVPVTAARRGDVGRIVLGTALPWTLLAVGFAVEDVDDASLRRISHWKWAGIDRSANNYPMLIGLSALGGASALLPAPEDGDGYSLSLRLDRCAVFVASMLVANGEVELFKPLFARRRPDGGSRGGRPSGHAASAFAAMTFCWDVLRDTVRPEEHDPVTRLFLEIGCAVPFLGASYVAIERVYARKHFLSDTLFGGAIGIFTTQMFYEWSFLREEVGASWLDGVSLAYEPGGFQLAWRTSF